MPTPVSDDPLSRAETSSVQMKALAIQLAALPAKDLMSLLRTLPPEYLKEALEQSATDVDAFNKRRHVRRRVLRRAKLVYNNGTCTLDCEIRDISDGGCRVRLGSPILLPKFLELHIQGDALERKCEIRWRSTKELGLLFLTANVLR